ncbi:MAG: SH3 domain-containing protein [Paracoccaceae bacterium]
MYVTLLIAGKDEGQLRPGLAKAVADGTLEVVQRRTAAVAVAAPPAVAVAPAPAEEEAMVSTAAYIPAAAEAPAQRIEPQPIFTLSGLPTVTRDPVEETVAAAPAATYGEVWYVTARSVNVRQDATTSSLVVEKLSRGEAVMVSFEEGSEWAKVTIEGDGLQGYIALRLLSPVAP